METNALEHGDLSRENARIFMGYSWDIHGIFMGSFFVAFW